MTSTPDIGAHQLSAPTGTPDPVLVGVSNARFVSIAGINGRNNDTVWILTFDVTKVYSNDISEVVRYSVNLNANNANVRGSWVFGSDHALAGYTLIYDIRGNGSNIADFRIVK